MKSLLSILSLVLTTSAFAASEPYIAPYLNDKGGAFSFTFDDGFKGQVADTVAILDPLGIKGTFFVIPTRIEDPKQQGMSVNWTEVKALQANGHEVGTHNTVAVKMHQAPEDQVRELISGSSDLIEQNTGVRSVSYARPGGTNETPEIWAIIQEKHYFFRDPKHLPNMTVVGYGNAGKRKWDDQATRKQIEKAIQDGKWYVPMVHSIVGGYAPFDSKDAFREHCEWLVSQEDVLWIAPLGVVGRYVFERDATKLVITNQAANAIRFTLTCSLTDKEIFNAPLTVVIPGTNATKATAKDAQGNELEVTVKDGKILVNALPNGEPVTVTW